MADRGVSWRKSPDPRATIGVMWTLNVFNFMDGVDCIAKSEGIFKTCGGGLMLLSGALEWAMSAAATWGTKRSDSLYCRSREPECLVDAADSGRCLVSGNYRRSRSAREPLGRSAQHYVVMPAAVT